MRDKEAVKEDCNNNNSAQYKREEGEMCVGGQGRGIKGSRKRRGGDGDLAER